MYDLQIFCICLLVIGMTTIFLFPFRLNSYNIMDHFGNFCAFHLSQLEPNVSRWKLAEVSVKCEVSHPLRMDWKWI